VLLTGASLATPLANPQPAGLSQGGSGGEPAGGGADVWQPFEPARIPALIAAGHTVFVTVTADWCLTCKVNERLVLERDAVRTRLAASHVVAMQADWTRRDEAIGRYLASFGRHGIPFDAVYGPGAPSGEALPELLTPSLVIDALNRAEGKRQAAAAAR
jgi:suppressor for copper-sensitivity B